MEPVDQPQLDVLPQQAVLDPFPAQSRHCCRKCETGEKGKRSCICVVPRSHRRVQILQGCVPCGCKGCSEEETLPPGLAPRWQCCDKCEHAKNGKPCFCQMPKNQRKSWVAIEGCKVCSCKGCNMSEAPRRSRSRDRSRQRHRDRERRRQRSRERERERERDRQSRSSQSQMDNLQNFDKGTLGKILENMAIYPPILGFGVPQRTFSYIMGKPH